MESRRSAFLAAMVAAALLLAACTNGGGSGTSGTGGNEKIGTVSVIGVWGGGEIDSFNEVVSKWQTDTGGKMEFEGTRDLSAILRARVAGGNPPDLAILPNPALMEELAKQGALKPIDDVVDIKGSYADTWAELGTVDGKLYGMFVRAATKSTVWYDPKTFDAAGYTIPKTWDELVSLTDEIKAAGGPAPWAMGMESGGASGWPGTDWIQEILLTESGPDVYDKWVKHEIPWTDPKVKSAWEKFGQMALGEGNVAGGAATIASTNFQDASYLPFDDPPRAEMYFLGSFVQGFLAEQFPDKKAGTDYDFFKFVEINEPSTATGGGDIIVMLNDTAGARSLMEYLADGANWESWAKAGGFATPNEKLDASVYPDDLARKAAEQLTQTTTFRFDADDLMPAEVQNAYFSGVLQYVQSPGDLDAILANIESVAAGAYQ